MSISFELLKKENKFWYLSFKNRIESDIHLIKYLIPVNH